MWRVVLAIGCTTGCSFSGPSLTSDGPVVAPPDNTVAVDAAPLATQWAVIASDDGVASSMDVLPFDASGFATPCARQPIARSIRSLAIHPTLPYAYGVGLGLQGYALGCGHVGQTQLADIGNYRTDQTVVAAATVGFFTIDGPGANGVYRFTIAGDGTPTVIGSTPSPASTGATVLAPDATELFVAGNVIARWDTPAPDHDFGAISGGSACAAPVALLLSGTSLLSFCADTPDIQRYARNPLSMTPTSAGALGKVGWVVAAAGDRAIAARSAPSQLVAIDLHGGAPTWTDGPTLASPATSLAVSPDGSLLVTTRSIDAATTEVALWKVAGDAITPIATTQLAGTATAAAVLPAP